MIKRLTSLMLITALLYFNTATASALEKFYPNELKEAKNVYTLAYDYFKGAHELKPGDTLDPDLLMDPKRQQALYKITRLLALALDAGYDISDMAEFGLEIKPNGYTIDYSQSLQWASLGDLFFRINMPGGLKIAKYYLINSGFSEADFEVLEAHLSQSNPKELTKLNEINIIKKFAQGYNPNGLKQPAEVKYLVSYIEKTRKSEYDTWNLWATRLLKKYSKQKQRILLTYLQQKMFMRTVGSFPIDEFNLELQGKQLASGEALRMAQAGLARIRKPENH